MKFLITTGILLVFQVHTALLLAQTNAELPKPDLKITIKNGYLNLSVKLNEQFKWENTKFESIKKFPMRGGARMPHLIHFRDKGNITWRQTDVVFTGLYKTHETSAQDLLDQYTEKNGFGFSWWNVDKNQNLKSFNEQTGKNEYLTPKEFADKFNLNYERDYNKIQALITGFQGEINGVYNPENDLLNFSDEDYVPIFSVPKFIMEQSKDLRKWTKVQLADPIPENYLWPEDIKIEIKKYNKENTFYRITIKEE